MRAVQQRAPVGTEADLADVTRNRRLPQVLEIVGEERAVRGFVLVVVPRVGNALDRKARVEHAILHRHELLVLPLLDRKAENAPGDFVEVDVDAQLLGLLRFLVIVVIVIVLVVAVDRTRLRYKR